MPRNKHEGLDISILSSERQDTHKQWTPKSYSSKHTEKGLPEKFESSPRLEIKVTFLTPFFPHLPPKSMSSYSSGPMLLYSIIFHPSLHSLCHSLIRFCFFIKYLLDISTNLLTSLRPFSSLHIILHTTVTICKFQI